MNRDAIVRELESVCDATCVYQCNLVAAGRFLDALGCTLDELSVAEGDEAVAELEDEIREHLIRVAAACTDYLVFGGLSFVAAWEQLTDRRALAGSPPAAGRGPGLARDDWYDVLRHLHRAAVGRRAYEAAPFAGDPPVPDSFSVTMTKLGASAVAALEGLDASEPLARRRRSPGGRPR